MSQQDFPGMVKRAGTGGLTTLNQLRVALWLGRQREPATTRQAADGTGVSQSVINSIYKMLEYLGHVRIEVRVEWSFDRRRSVLVAELTLQGRRWLEMIHGEVVR